MNPPIASWSKLAPRSPLSRTTSLMRTIPLGSTPERTDPISESRLPSEIVQARQIGVELYGRLRIGPAVSGDDHHAPGPTCTAAHSPMDLRSEVSCTFWGSALERLGNFGEPSGRLHIASEAQ